MRFPALLALLLAAHVRAAAVVDGERDLIGWSERSSGGGGSGGAGGKVVRDFSGVSGDSDDGKPSSRLPPNARMEVLSWEPRIFLYRNILSEAEADHLVAKAEPRLSRSGVVKEGGGDQISEIRTSSGMFFERGEDDVIAAVESRLSEWSLIPVEHGEGIQVLRYEQSQKYEPHFDAFFEDVFQDNGGQRTATVLQAGPLIIDMEMKRLDEMLTNEPQKFPFAVLVGCGGGRRDSFPQRSSAAAPDPRGRVFSVRNEGFGGATAQGRRGPLLLPASRRRVIKGIPPRRVPCHQGRQVRR